MNCPVCSTPLQNKIFEGQNVDFCFDCGGVWLDKGELPNIVRELIRNNKVEPFSTKELLQRKVIPVGPNRPIRRCPRCKLDLKVINYAYNTNVFLDRCRTCEGLWVDNNEISMIAKIMRGNPTVNKYALVLNDITAEIIKSRNDFREVDDLSRILINANPIRNQLYVPITPVPLGVDMLPTRFAKVTFGLVMFNTMIFIIQAMYFSPEDQAYFSLVGVIPDFGFTVGRAYSFISSLFIHGSFWHILGNMYFLWLFGTNVEDALGSKRFIIFYLLCGILAGVVFCLVEPNVNVPAIGASGAISGILGAFVVLFSKVGLKVLWLSKVRTIPSGAYLLIWFMFQWLYGLVQLENQNIGIGYWDHIGGFVSGVVLVRFFIPKTNA